MDELSKKEKPINYYQYIFENSIKSDVDIVLQDKVIKAHKQILGQQNPVFLDTFISRPDLNRLETLDLDSDAVETFINYLYTGRVSVGNVNEDLFQVAHRYLDVNLKNVCREKFANTLNTENAVKRLLVFLDCQEAKLLKETAIFIARNFNDVKLCSDFNHVVQREEAIKAIIGQFDFCKITVLSENKNPDHKKLVDSATKSDLTIKVRDHLFLGHKDILSNRNRVFDTVISALPSTNNVASSISIPDFDPKTFKIFLQFVYTQKVDDAEISQQLLNVAHKYVESRLQKICENNLVSTVCEENAFKLLILGADVGSQNLKETAAKFIADRYGEMKELVGFQDVKENLAAFEAIFNQFSIEIDSLKLSLKVQKSTYAFVGTFVLKVPLTVSRVFSEPFYMKNQSWSVYAELILNNLTNVGLFFYCGDGNIDCEYQVNYKLQLFSSVDKQHDITSSESTRTFSPTNSWGYKNFVSYTDLNDEKRGLMTNGAITVKLEAHLVE